ncbi:HAMP domain-containing histidine kinase [Clostridium algoriphilum]|uniref:sensor histidine kinase n=1 Tax=Clostridium algoriphilum TaxID=198347 RepID=UPI001CF33F20|nr:HAMP domain-containing sensor histidine kinase [Clostridium algoriphilum]MCB2294074.1 HAMP domain-containing histidine kinase [Clostridium algoriphilum]
MKNKSLFFQIGIVFAGIIIGLSVLLAFLFPIILREFFTNEVYSTIEGSQYNIINRRVSKNLEMEYESEQGNDVELDIRSVTHIQIPNEGISDASKLKITKAINSSEVDLGFVKEIIRQGESQNKLSKRYVKRIGNKNIFYVITKYKNNNKSGFLLSYMWDTYRNNLLKTLLQKLLIITFMAVGISLCIALTLAKYITSPIIRLEKNVKKIARKQWDEPIIFDRQDEIGSLAGSIEHMRKELIKRDDSQQWMLQNISHELKTPVMVIRSYSEAVGDGIFPKGDLKSSMKIISDEAERLEKRIKDLLYLSKLEYLSKHVATYGSINIKKIIEDVVDKLKFTNENLNWELKLLNINFKGIKDQWTVVIENILDNQIRYARKEIKIFIHQNDRYTSICIHNDGEKIPRDDFEKIFNKFEKGKTGKFGLGMAIAKYIVEYHKGEIYAINENNGVSFYIKIPI